MAIQIESVVISLDTTATLKHMKERRDKSTTNDWDDGKMMLL